MIGEPILLDSDTLSELSRGHPMVTRRAREYLATHGRLTISSVTVFERLRGYRAAIRQGKRFESHLRQFEALAQVCIVLPVDGIVADHAATIWAGLGARRRGAVGDILIAATAVANALPLATRNRRDFDAMAKVDGVALKIVDWAL